MKKENKLVVKLLDALAAKHSHMSFLYGYDESLNQHIIEVAPTESYENEQYLLDEANATAEFLSNFPHQGILFISNDPYLKVAEPIYNSAANVRKVKLKRSASLGIFQGNSGKGLAK
ncbi:hypothetical protein [Dyadobacter pollutisoli]|uniref:Uncharacterized protein n=1 Tax=Dyadobacter pollutisoli TaxID=2910158 RepID=A0A9E8N785_9BACT|nr:hypothetical protein [Dyadobacter pollutisoli]WAC09222.1 hypothetical protein ON006_15830 [Dyadobacter pollutisoli]